MTPKEKLTKAYYKFLVYFPVLVIFSIIVIIYSTYVSTYIKILLDTEHTVNNQISPKSTYYAFHHTSKESGAKSKGIVLLCFETYFLAMLLLSILRTLMVNPGFLPSPIDMEYKLIQNKRQRANKSEKTFEESDSITNISNFSEAINCNYNNNSKQASYITIRDQEEENENICFKRNEKQNGYNRNYPNRCSKPNREDIPVNRIKSSAHLEELICEAPLTASESITFRNDINNFIDSVTKRNSEVGDNAIANSSNNNASMSCKNKNKCNTSLDNVLDSFNNINVSDLKLCPTCLRVKVERSHHCRMCGKCVLRMDHHCPWLANCIGFNNYKYFLLVHLYGSIATFIVAVTYWEVVVNSIVSYNTSLIGVGFVIFVYVCNLGMFSFLMWLLITNWRMMFTGQTIIENSDRERFKLTNTINVYDLGWFKNFVTVFGKNPLIWFVPFFTNNEGCGVIFQHRNTEGETAR